MRRVKHTLRGSTLAETLVMMLVAGIVFLAAMEALTLVSRLVARRAAVLVEAGRQHDGIFRLGQLLTTADSVRGAEGGGTGELLYLYRAGGETTLTTRDSAAVFVAGEFRDTLLRRVGHMQLLRCDAAADTLEIDVGGHMLKLTVLMPARECYGRRIAEIEKALLEELYAAVVRGETLAEAMRRSGAFRPLECGVVRIGDETGRLARTLDFLRDYYRKRAAQRRMVASAVSYPVVILAVAAAVVAFMLSVVVPMFEEVYARMGGELPALTRGIIALSKAFPAYAAVAVIAGGGLYLLYRANRQREEVQRWRAAILLRLPVAGEIIRKNMQAQCCKLLDLLCAAGVPLLAGVGMLREVIGFHPYRKSFDEIERRLERGDAFAETLARFPDLYDRKLTALVRVGEQTNRLPEMLRRQGETLTEELEYAIRRMGAMLEPALILLVGILVAVILIAMYMPMFSLGGIMG